MVNSLSTKKTKSKKKDSNEIVAFNKALIAKEYTYEEDLAFLKETMNQEWNNYYCNGYSTYTWQVTRSFKLWYYARFDNENIEERRKNHYFKYLTEHSLYFRIKNLFFSIKLKHLFTLRNFPNDYLDQILEDLSHELLERISRVCFTGTEAQRRKFLNYNWNAYTAKAYRLAVNKEYFYQKQNPISSMSELIEVLNTSEFDLQGFELEEVILGGNPEQTIYTSPDFNLNITKIIESICKRLNSLELPYDTYDTDLFNKAVRRMVLHLVSLEKPSLFIYFKSLLTKQQFFSIGILAAKFQYETKKFISENL